MFALGNSKVSFVISSVAISVLLFTSPAETFEQKLGLGEPASPEEIAGWDIDIRPDGQGLPEGSGDALAGEGLFIQKCAACHGEFAEGAGRYPPLAGGLESLDTHDPVKTVGSYWPYASTVFDYIRRAMPFGHAQSLTSDEVYAMTAYILYSSDIIEDDYVLNRENLASVEMPNSGGFIDDPRPDVASSEPCMKNCLSELPRIVGKARVIDVTPEQEQGTAMQSAGDNSQSERLARGKVLFSQCIACHSTNEGENKFGPTLHALVGRKIGGVEGFSNYSAVMRSQNQAWSHENLREFLRSPQTFLPGTSMPFAGIQNENELEDLLVYLAAPNEKQ